MPGAETRNHSTSRSGQRPVAVQSIRPRTKRTNNLRTTMSRSRRVRRSVPKPARPAEDPLEPTVSVLRDSPRRPQRVPPSRRSDEGREDARPLALGGAWSSRASSEAASALAAHEMSRCTSMGRNRWRAPRSVWMARPSAGSKGSRRIRRKHAGWTRKSAGRAGVCASGSPRAADREARLSADRAKGRGLPLARRLRGRGDRCAGATLNWLAVGVSNGGRVVHRFHNRGDAEGAPGRS